MNREVIFLWDILLIFKVLAFHLVKLTIVNFSSLGKVVYLRIYVERDQLTNNNSVEGFFPLKLVHDFQVSPYVYIIVNEAPSKIKLVELRWLLMVWRREEISQLISIVRETLLRVIGIVVKHPKE